MILRIFTTLPRLEFKISPIEIFFHTPSRHTLSGFHADQLQIDSTLICKLACYSDEEKSIKLRHSSGNHFLLDSYQKPLQISSMFSEKSIKDKKLMYSEKKSFANRTNGS